MALMRFLSTMLLAFSMLLSGCVLPTFDDTNVVIPEEPEIDPVDAFPEVLVEGATIAYGAAVRISGTVIDEDSASVEIYIALAPEDTALGGMQAIPPFNAGANGDWTIVLPIEEPGTWLVGVSVTDSSMQSSDVSYITVTMEVPLEFPAVIQVTPLPPADKQEAVSIDGVVQHMFPSSCMVLFLPEDGGQFSSAASDSGQFLIEVGVLPGNLSGTLEARCGVWTQSTSSLPFVLVLAGADDADDDGINDEFDSCPQGDSGWHSSTLTDHDLDGCRDATEDSDDDGDGVQDSDDLCPKGVQGWISSPSNDIDGDGCSDQDEDLDDDGDGVGDLVDSCPAGESGWISNSATDHDGDGCRDGIEDDDSDDDGLIDMIDQCPFGDLQWSSDNGTDWDGDGCRDAGEDTDDDADGVVDGNDACPFTTDAASADADGCDDLQRDSDDDGVLDMDDTCPGTPLGLEVSSNGCGDRDGDGIPFDEDLCPTTPAEFLDEVNEFGCADIDGDGVSEDLDDCPASPPRWTIDAAGCAVVQLPIPWNVGPYATTPTSLAGGFSVTTFSGTWTLQNEWSGHETYLFFARYAASSYNTDLWSQDVGDLISSLPQQNSHFFFASFDSSYHNDMLTMQQRVENHITTLSSAEEAHWREHIHYIDQNFWDVSGSLGDVRDDWQSFYYGIDRFQRWREVGSLYSWGTSSNTYQLKSLANEALMYDSEFRAEIRKDDPGITVVTVFDDQWHSGGWSGGYSSYSNASLPNSSVMAEFNTLEIYLYHACDEHKNRYDSDGDGQSDAGCHEWDYMEYVRLCEEVGNHSTCSTEFARYITTYGREGRWLTDISPFLFMLKEGGTREFKLETANGGGITAILLLSTWGDDGLRPDSAEYLFDGGQFRGDYNNESIYKRHHELTIPQDTVKVELVALITGHGFGNDDANCAEFCNHEHRFTLNGLSTQEDHPMAGNSSVSSDNRGCEKLTAEGVTANQLGSWPFGRAGWCPGLDVEQWTFDITNWIDWTGENNLTYAGLFDGQNYIPQNEGGGSTQTIRVTSWVVYYVNSSGGVGITAQTPEDSQADSTALAEGEPTADGQQQIQLTTRRPRIADVGSEDNR